MLELLSWVRREMCIDLIDHLMFTNINLAGRPTVSESRPPAKKGWASFFFRTIRIRGLSSQVSRVHDAGQ